MKLSDEEIDYILETCEHGGATDAICQLKEERDRYRVALEGAHEGLMYAMNVINNYEIHIDGSKVTASTNFCVIRKRYAETKQALGNNEENA